MDKLKSLTTLPTGETFNVLWPGDNHGGGSKPAIPVRKRGDFIADVRGAGSEVPPLSTADLRKKWGKHLTSDRTLFKWVAWARGLEPVKPEPEQ